MDDYPIEWVPYGIRNFIMTHITPFQICGTVRRFYGGWRFDQAIRLSITFIQDVKEILDYFLQTENWAYLIEKEKFCSDFPKDRTFKII